MNQQTIDRIQSLLLSDVTLRSRQDIEASYPPRGLAADAIVTRSAPSPTGFLHIGTIYMCLLNQYLARQTGGVYMLRIEDTDKKREITDGIAQIVAALNAFDLVPDEGVKADGSSYGAYGPYLQSQRRELYLSYAVDLLQKGRAYPCFATKEELDASYTAQQAAKVRPGYYGKWALWRDRSDQEIAAQLDAGMPFVLRFKSNGSHDKRVGFDDVLKGHLELPENDLDVPLIKADGSQLPTYHLAHVVDDYLMKTTFVLRGDEWLPSTPLHIELCDALGIPRYSYAHFAPISIMDSNGGGKRKLSKRKDPEADVQYWLNQGYPIEGIKPYLLGLADSSFEDWYRANPNKPLADFRISLKKLSASRAPLLDTAKLDDYTKEYIASLPIEEFEAELKHSTNKAFRAALNNADKQYLTAVLSIERFGDKRRKDIAKWSDGPDQYGYFFDELYEADFAPQIGALLEAFDTTTLTDVCKAFFATYDPDDDQPTWFEKLKKAATVTGFATDNKAFKADPNAFKGNVADFAKILRVKLTGKDRTPDLYTIMQVMGIKRVKARLQVL
ncbi:glutamate--tRNA ligase [bacterium]|nr:glutamate--tRNA ligase [bacterium]NBX97932.1 glutamate--tRNA ligase [bacterium]NDC94324.1 glutamate--tRNA ligase [bacterium]NDD82776.1 glutamate--tRNA ligase [bacterium]NDG28824.1 glutamate--tRNA ligase [bacterium]